MRDRETKQEKNTLPLSNEAQFSRVISILAITHLKRMYIEK